MFLEKNVYKFTYFVFKIEKLDNNVIFQLNFLEIGKCKYQITNFYKFVYFSVICVRMQGVFVDVRVCSLN